MKFARHKRLLLGVFALLAPLPLPLNEPRPGGVVGWPFLVLFLAAIGVYLYRAASGTERWLRPWMLNALGCLYLPFLVLDMTVWFAGSLVRPMMHLALFALVAKLFSLRNERDKWHATIGLFFVFVTSIATSTHPAIVVYLVAVMSFGLLLLTRFTYLHLKDLHEEPGRLVLGPRSVKRFVAAMTLAAALVAVPIFTLLPRFGSPYLTGRTNSSTASFGLGFSDEVTLDVIGQARTSTEVAIRIEMDQADLPASDFRWKGGAYDRYVGASWQPATVMDTIGRDRAGRYVLSEGRPSSRMKVWMQPLRARGLPLPIEAMELRMEEPALRRTIGGSFLFPTPPRTVLEFEVGLSSLPVALALPPDPLDFDEPTMADDGISPEIRALASEVAGEGTSRVRARRVESHLIREYEYTLDFLRRSADAPIDDFLFTFKSGHCEFFASAMVLMLRAEGIPARFVTGYLGAEYNPIEGYYVVRQNNAHAWVEAWIPEEGWVTFDPTPPAGRPIAAPPSLHLVLRQAWDWVQFRWDRYIISFSARDQRSFFASVRELMLGLIEPVSLPATADELERQSPPEAMIWWALLAASGLLTGAWLSRPRFSATRAFGRFRLRAEKRGVEIDAAVAPVDVRERVVLRFPESKASADRLLGLYLRESFGQQELSPAERREVARALREASRVMKAGSDKAIAPSSEQDGARRSA